MIAELPAPSAPTATVAAQGPRLSIDLVTAELQLILAARRAARNAESRMAHPGAACK